MTTTVRSDAGSSGAGSNGAGSNGAGSNTAVIEGIVLADHLDLPDREKIRSDADALTSMIRLMSSRVATGQAELLAWIDAADRDGVWQQWYGIRSLTHWIAFVCEISAHTAREYARAMRGLRLMPEVAEYFHAGRLTYSKVRAVTRVAGRVNSAQVAEFALVTKASQLELSVSTWIALDDANSDDPRKQSEDLNDEERNPDWLRLDARGHGRARLVVEMDEADAGQVMAYIQARRDALIRAHRDNEAALGCVLEDEPAVGSGLPTPVDAFLDIVRASGRGPADVRSESTMVVHVSTDVLERACDAMKNAAGANDVAREAPADNSTAADGQSAADKGESVPAGTPDEPPQPERRREQVGYIDRVGPVKSATVGRLACNSAIAGAALGRDGDVLSLGRSKRLASRRQRLALKARDIGCQFPGCRRTVGIEVHHIRTWAEGGGTDMVNMLQLCRAHHVTVHKHAITIWRTAYPFMGAYAGTGMEGTYEGPAFRFFTTGGHEIAVDDRCEDARLTVGDIIAQAEQRLREQGYTEYGNGTPFATDTVETEDTTDTPDTTDTRDASDTPGATDACEGSDSPVSGDSAEPKVAPEHKAAPEPTDPVILEIADGKRRPPVCEGPNRVETIGGGEGFSLNNCVAALFDMKVA